MDPSLSSNSSATIAVAAIMRSAAPRRGCRHPGMGSGGIRIEGDRVEHALERTSRGPAESSASVTALIAISSGRSSRAIRSRSITMLVSSRPRRGTSLVEGSFGLIGGGILVAPIAAARRIAASLFTTLDWSARRVGPPESHARHVHGGGETCASPP
jgi:hypothetical protein